MPPGQSHIGNARERFAEAVAGLEKPFRRRTLVDNLRAVIQPGGRYFMLCFSDRQPGCFGPRWVTQEEIRASFGEGWQVDSIEPAKLDIRISPDGILAWLARIRRT